MLRVSLDKIRWFAAVCGGRGGRRHVFGRIFAFALASALAWPALAVPPLQAATVRSVSPQGVVSDARQVDIAFDADMVALGQSNAAAPATVRCTPAASGQGRWIQPGYWAFTFDRDLPLDTQCTVNFNPTLHALYGQPVSGAAPVRFSTPHWRIESIDPGEDGETTETGAIFLRYQGAALPGNPAQALAARLSCEVEPGDEPDDEPGDGQDNRQNGGQDDNRPNGGQNARPGRARDQTRSMRPVLVADDAPTRRIARARHYDASVTALRCGTQPLPSGSRIRLRYTDESGAFRVLNYSVRAPFTATFACTTLSGADAMPGEKNQCDPGQLVSLVFSSKPDFRADSASGKTPARTADGDAIPDPRIRYTDAQGRSTALHSVARFNADLGLGIDPPANGFGEGAHGTLDVPHDLVDVDGRPLANAADFPRTIHFGRLPPYLGVPNADMTLPFSGLQRAPSATLAVRNLEASPGLQFWRMGGEAGPQTDANVLDLVNRNNPANHRPEGMSAETYVTTLIDRLTAKLGAPQSFALKTHGGPLEFVDTPAFTAPGLYIVRAQSLAYARYLKALASAYPDRGISTSGARYAVVQVTNLNPLANLSNAGRSVVWVSALDTARPVPDAHVAIYSFSGRQLLWRGQTGPDGLADVGDALRGKFGQNGSDAVWIIVHQGRDLAVLRGRVGATQRGLDAWGPQPYRVHTVLDRTLFAAGETVHMAHFARLLDSRGFGVPPATQLDVQILYDSLQGGGASLYGGSPVARMTTQLDAHGAGQSTWTIPASAKLGAYHVMLSHGGDILASTAFQVEEFRNPNFEMRSDATARWTGAKQVVSANAHVDYYAGGPASGLHVRTTYHFDDQIEPPVPGYTFFSADPAKRAGDSLKELPKDLRQSAVLDAHGNAAMRVVIPPLKRPLLLRSETSFLDANGETLTTGARTMVWPDTLKLGLRAERPAAEGKPAMISGIALDSENHPIALEPVTVRAVRIVARAATDANAATTAGADATANADDIATMLPRPLLRASARAGQRFRQAGRAHRSRRARQTPPARGEHGKRYTRHSYHKRQASPDAQVSALAPVTICQTRTARDGTWTCEWTLPPVDKANEADKTDGDNERWLLDATDDARTHSLRAVRVTLPVTRWMLTWQSWQRDANALPLLSISRRGNDDSDHNGSHASADSGNSNSDNSGNSDSSHSDNSSNNRDGNDSSASRSPQNLSFNAGDVAVLTLRPDRLPATLLLTSEREGVTRAVVKLLTQPVGKIDWPIRAEDAPNFLLVARYVYPLDETWGTYETRATRNAGETAPSPPSSQQSIDVTVRPASFSLNVDVRPATRQSHPRARVPVTVTVRDAAKQPVAGAQVTLVAVDEALLALRGNPTWDLARVMLERRYDLVAHAALDDFLTRRVPAGLVPGSRQPARFGLRGTEDNDTLALNREYGSPMDYLAPLAAARAPVALAAPVAARNEATASASGPSSLSVRQDLKPLIAWRTALMTDANGVAHATIPLNDALTRFRVVAIVTAGASRFGNGEATITSTQPLQLFSGLPPLLRAGDNLAQTISVRNTTQAPLDVTLSAVARAHLTTDASPDAASAARGRANRTDWMDWTVRAGQARQADRPDWTGQTDQAGQANQADRAGQVDRANQEDQADQPDRRGQVDRVNQADRANQEDQADQPDRAGQTDRVNQVDRVNQANQANQANRANQSDQANQPDRTSQPDQASQADNTAPLAGFSLEKHLMLAAGETRNVAWPIDVPKGIDAIRWQFTARATQGAGAARVNAANATNAAHDPDATDATDATDALQVEQKVIPALPVSVRAAMLVNVGNDAGNGMNGATSTNGMDNAAGTNGATGTDSAAGANGVTDTDNAAGMNGTAGTDNATGASLIPIAKPQGAQGDAGGVQVDLQASLVAAALTGPRQWMTTYPYHCLEQQGSRFITLDDRAGWDALMASLPTYLDQAGFARYFPDDKLDGSETLTMYVLDVARARNWPVPGASRDRMLDALARLVDGRQAALDWAPDNSGLLDQQLAAQATLAEYGRIGARNAGNAGNAGSARPMAVLKVKPRDLSALSVPALIDWGRTLLALSASGRAADAVAGAAGDASVSSAATDTSMSSTARNAPMSSVAKDTAAGAAQVASVRTAGATSARAVAAASEDATENAAKTAPEAAPEDAAENATQAAVQSRLKNAPDTAPADTAKAASTGASAATSTSTYTTDTTAASAAANTTPNMAASAAANTAANASASAPANTATDVTVALAEVEHQLRARYDMVGGRMRWRDEQALSNGWYMQSGDTAAARAALFVEQLARRDGAWQPDVPLVVQGLVGRQADGRWSTTIGNAWGTLALRRFGEQARQGPVTGRTRLTFGGETRTVQWARQTPQGQQAQPGQRVQSRQRDRQQGQPESEPQADDGARAGQGGGWDNGRGNEHGNEHDNRHDNAYGNEHDSKRDNVHDNAHDSAHPGAQGNPRDTVTAAASASPSPDESGSAHENDPRASAFASSAASFRWPHDEPAGAFAGLRIEHQGTGRPWAAIRVLAAVAHSTPVVSGLKVTRTVTPVEQKRKGQWSVGDTCRVRLDLESLAAQAWVVVRDAVPSGATQLGRGLGGESALAQQGEKRDEWYGEGYPTYVERATDSYRAFFRRVLRGHWSVEYTMRLNNAGTFTLPPVRAEAMYAPEVYGEGVTQVMKVAP